MKHIIFDLDGTLIDSMPVWDGTGVAYLTKNNIPVPSDLREKVKILTVHQTAEYFRDELNITIPLDEIVKGIVDYVEDAYRYHIPLKPYAREYLEQEKANGTKMCILTASEARYIYPTLERLDILQYFDFIMTCTEVGHYKDEPLVFDLAMERLGGHLDDTIVFEDAIHAIKSAKAGGHIVYAVADTATEPDRDEISVTADKYIKDFKELLL